MALPPVIKPSTCLQAASLHVCTVCGIDQCTLQNNLLVDCFFDMNVLRMNTETFDTVPNTLSSIFS